MKTRSARGAIRPPDPQAVLFRQRATSGVKVRVRARAGEAGVPQIEVKGPAPSGSPEKGPTLFLVDEAGNVTCVDIACATIEISGAITVPEVIYSPPITKKIWCHTGWTNIAGFTAWNYNGADDSWTSQVGSGSIALAIPVPSGPGTYTLTSLALRMKKAGTSATGFVVGHSHGLSATGGDVASTADVTITDSTSGNRILTASGLTLAMTDDIAVYVTINNADDGDKVYGVFAEFTATQGA